MKIFPMHTLETAPEASRPALETLQTAFGFLPNIAAAMATSSTLTEGLVALFGPVHHGSFTESELQIILLTDAVTNGANWAVAFHSYLALKEGISANDVNEIRAGRSPHDLRPSALATLARSLIERRGQITNDDQQAFLAAGFTPAHLLEVVTVVAASTITNYTANITQPPLEPDLVPHTWERKNG